MAATEECKAAMAVTADTVVMPGKRVLDKEDVAETAAMET